MEEDPREIIQSVYECIERTCEKLVQLNVNVSSIKGRPRVHLSLSVVHGVLARWSFVEISVAFVSAVGVTNQRETTLVWDKETGEPLYRAIGEFGISERSALTSFLECFLELKNVIIRVNFLRLNNPRTSVVLLSSAVRRKRCVATAGGS